MSGTAKKDALSVYGLSLKRLGPENEGGVAQRLQYIPWVQDRLWNARVVDGKIVAEPVFSDPERRGKASSIRPTGTSN